MRRLLPFALVLVFALCHHAFAQAPGVPIYKQGRHESKYEDDITAISKELFATGNIVKLPVAKEQLKRTSCQLTLPPIRTTKLSSRELCDTGRRSHLRVGWAFVCDKCDQWHVNLAGGYVLTTNGAVATCYHVVQPERAMVKGCLLAADETGKVFPVTEILAANRYSDACIVRIAADGLAPLPLNTNASPGDAAFCYSDPLDHRGYFSSGVINRFYQFPGRRPFSAPASAAYAPTRLNVSTDWAPGSSGSAVLDECGNAIGHVSTIAVAADEESSEPEETNSPPVSITTIMMITFHEAVSARDVLLLVRPPE